MGDNVVIIIDPWAWSDNGTVPREKLSPELANCIINFINSNKIHTVVLASYNCHIDMYSSTVWYQNRLPLENFIEYWPTHHDQETIDVMLNYVNSNVFQIAMRNEKELEVYLLQHPEITNIYVVGEAWEICVKDRPLGYENVYEKFCRGNNRRLLTSLDCVRTYNSEIPVPDNNWQAIDQLVYQYCPN